MSKALNGKIIALRTICHEGNRQAAERDDAVVIKEALAGVVRRAMVKGPQYGEPHCSCWGGKGLSEEGMFRLKTGGREGPVL